MKQSQRSRESTKGPENAEVKQCLSWVSVKFREERTQKLNAADWRFDWFRVTEREEKHQHQRSTTHDESNTNTFLCYLNFPSESRFSSPTSHFLSVVIWTQTEEQGLFSEQCYSWLHVTAHKFVVIDKRGSKGWLPCEKLLTSRRFYSRMLPWNADNTIWNQKSWLQQGSRADGPPSLDPQRLKGPYRKVIC